MDFVPHEFWWVVIFVWISGSYLLFKRRPEDRSVLLTSLMIFTFFAGVLIASSGFSNQSLYWLNVLTTKILFLALVFLFFFKSKKGTTSYKILMALSLMASSALAIRIWPGPF